MRLNSRREIIKTIIELSAQVSSSVLQSSIDKPTPMISIHFTQE